MKKHLLVISLYFLVVSVFGQTNTELQGIVYNANSNETLSGASITIFHSGKITGLVANKEGRFAVPAGTIIDSLRVSMVGHYSKTFPGDKLNTISTLEIRLDIAAAELQEVVVKPFTALDVMKKAIAKLLVNQPQDNFENKGFYREIIKDRENYFSVAEAVFTAQYYPPSKDYKLKMEQGRSKEDVAYTRLFEDFHPGGGPQAVAGNSFITGRPSFLNLKEVNKFHYKIDSMVQFDGRWLYHISFDQNAGVKEALDKGYLLIETEDYAVVRYEVENSPLGTAYIKNLTGSDKIFAEILNIDFKRKGWKRRVDFTNVNNKWVMSYAGTEYTIAYKQPKKELDLDLTINIELAFTDLYRTVNKEIEKGEEWKKKNIVANLPTAFDPAFWGNNNIISPTEQVKSIIAGISKNNNDLPAVASLPGWQYLNRNLFVSYKQNDTITLIPVMKCIWEDDETAAMLFQEMDSNFIVESKITVAKNSDNGEMPDRGFQQGGIIVRSAGNPKENYVFLSMGTGGNPNPKMFFKRTIDNRSKTVVEKKDSMNGWLRIEKSGKKITAFFKEENTSDYKKVGEYNLDWLNGKLQLGLATFAAFSSDGPKNETGYESDVFSIKNRNDVKKIFLTIIFAVVFANVFGCLILFITDGKNILVGNHEDWYASDAEVSFVPASGKKLGMLYFDFASEKTAQGGMNTAGLFFDGTRTPFAPYNDNDSKEDCKCYIWKKILEECTSVDDAVKYVERYKIPEIEDVHILFADKKGNSAVVGVYDGKLQIHKRNGNHQLLTNFNLTNPSYGDEPVCQRFATAEKMLAVDSTVSVDNIEKILSKTHQEKLTAYSNIYNLTTGEVYVYNHADFTRKIKLNLLNELKKGKHSVAVKALFK